MSLYDSDSGQVQCEFCYNKTYVSAEQREQDWAHHAAQCNTIVAATADTDLGMVPGAYESTAPARAWKSQDKPLPNYMLQHREPNGAVVQTVVHAPIAAPPAAGGGAAMGAGAVKIAPHTYTLSVALKGNEVHERTAAAPHGLIHAHAGDEASLELAKTRVASNGTTYWTPVAADADATFALRDGAHVSVSFVSGAGGARDKAGASSVQIEGTIPPNLDAHYARHLASLGTGLRGHLDQQLQAKGLPSAKRGTVAVVRGADPATGATATIAVHMDSKTGMATLADVEVHVPHVDAQAPMALQRETFNAHQVDVSDAQDVGALIGALTEHHQALEEHLESLTAIEATAESMHECQAELDVCAQHLEALQSHLDANAHIGADMAGRKVPAEVRSAVKYVTQDLFTVNNALFGGEMRVGRFVRELLRKMRGSPEKATAELQSIASNQLVPLAKAIQKLTVEIDKLTRKKAEATGFKSFKTGLVALPKMKVQRAAKIATLKEWVSAIDDVRATVSDVACNGAVIDALTKLQRTASDYAANMVLDDAPVITSFEQHANAQKTSGVGPNTQSLLYDPEDVPPTPARDDSDN